ncbi:MAG: hypothetical protein AMJ62_15685 [Myxococcales bacterium SG8_38]|nr:MAG: hypothetical protein AMJ62_15685 [Myxococcales bacterium SG8_38]
MRIEQDERFHSQRERFRLKWNCEDCALFDAEAGCAHGFPTHRHRKSRYEDASAELLFCKDFELA